MAASNSIRVVDPSIFSHQKLDFSEKQIRILRLLPGEWGHPIQCKLYTVYMSAHPPYEALSYAWGDATDRRPILVNGCLCEVTSNLAAALRRLRDPERNRHLWVDAICINQADNTEKSHQVNLMKDIYTKAEEGLMWLGNFEGDVRNDGFIASVEGTSNYEQVSSTDKSSSISSESFAPSALKSTTISQADAIRAFSLVRRLASNNHISHSKLAEETQALSALMNLAWWQRIWTVQEAILPRKVKIICGGLSVDWEVFASAASNFVEHAWRCCTETKPASKSSIFTTFYHRVDAIEWFRRHQLETSHITKLILRSVFISFQNRFASDPKDKVFGLLGLFPSGMQHLSKADYSLNKQQVYKQITYHMIKEFGDLFPLLRAHERKRQRTLPSWVPDLGANIDEYWLDLAKSWTMIYDLFDAAAGTQLDIGNKIMSDFRLQGVCVDEISAIMEWNDEDGATALVERFRELVTSVASFEDDYPCGDDYKGAFWRTLRRDFTIDFMGNGKGKYRRLRPAEFKQMQDLERLHHYKENFYTTNNGLVGVGSIGSRVGDKVYVLYGGKIPFILRPARKRGRRNCYRYVGQAYVHGIMDGEALVPTVDPEYVTLI